MIMQKILSRVVRWLRVFIYHAKLQLMTWAQELVFKPENTVKKSEKPKFEVFEPKAWNLS